MSETATNQVEGDEPLPEAGVVEGEGPGETEAGAAEVELDGEGNPIDPADEDEETEEVEHDGKKYAVPKGLKPALLMQADYTKKTQEVADLKRQHQEQVTQHQDAVAKWAEGDQAIVQDRAKVIAIDDQVGGLDKAITDLATQIQNVDFGALAQMENGHLALQQAQIELQALKDAKDKLLGDKTKLTTDIDAKIKDRTLAAQQASAKRFEERDAALKAEYPKWAEEFPAIQEFASKALGVPAESIATTPDARILKGLRYAKLGWEAEQRDLAAKEAAKRAKPAVSGAAPVKRVGGNSPPPTDPNRMSTADWMAHRRKQVASKSGR